MWIIATSAIKQKIGKKQLCFPLIFIWRKFSIFRLSNLENFGKFCFSSVISTASAKLFWLNFPNFWTWKKKRKEKNPVVLPSEAVVLFVTSKEAVCRRRSRHLKQGPTGASSRLFAFCCAAGARSSSSPSSCVAFVSSPVSQLLARFLGLALNTTHYYCLLHGDPRACQEQSFANGCVCSWLPATFFLSLSIVFHNLEFHRNCAETNFSPLFSFLLFRLGRVFASPPPIPLGRLLGFNSRWKRASSSFSSSGCPDSCAFLSRRMFYFSIHNLLHLWLCAGFPFAFFFFGRVEGGGDSNLLSPTRNWIVKLASSFGVLLVKLAIAVCSEELLLQLCFGFDFVLHFAARQKDIVQHTVRGALL